MPAVARAGSSWAMGGGGAGGTGSRAAYRAVKIRSGGPAGPTANGMATLSSPSEKNKR
jgi:hypothetical protein